MDTSPLIFIGPSGIGKNYFQSQLLDEYYPQCEVIVRYTTRPPRPDELSSKYPDYKHITKSEFHSLQHTMLVSMGYGGESYGFQRRAVDSIQEKGHKPIGNIHQAFIPQFLKAYPTATIVYLKPDNEEVLINHMRKRGESEEKIEQRLHIARADADEYERLTMLLGNKIKEIVVSDDNTQEVLAELRTYLTQEEKLEIPPVSRS